MSVFAKITDDNLPKRSQDAYSDLAPEPTGAAAPASTRQDWFAEFPDERKTPKPRTEVRRSAIDDLADEKR